jgi:SAM-dependent methyltransferase
MSDVLASRPCRSCGGSDTRAFYEAWDVPVNSVLLLSSREQALSFPTGDIELRFCNTCGFIFNALFDPKIVEYSSRCEETQGYSETFRRWHKALAERLIERHDLHHKEIIEIGCGKGEFLTMLCVLGENRGVGFDPAYVRERSLGTNLAEVEFVAQNYSPEFVTTRPDFVCCKMTLEHISNAAEFVAHLRSSLEPARDVIAFFQVPNAWRILSDVAFWDIYYEHCSYYTQGSLSRLFSRQGFDVLNVDFEYDEQYVTIEARPGTGKIADTVIPGEDLPTLEQSVARFSEHLPAWLAQWRQRLRDYKEQNRRVVVWGSGSKGVGFLTTVDCDGMVEYVVDINPNRQSHYMAKTGQKIVGPGFLQLYRPDVVIVMNRIYRDEIDAEMRRRGVDAEILTT